MTRARCVAAALNIARYLYSQYIFHRAFLPRMKGNNVQNKNIIAIIWVCVCVCVGVCFTVSQMV